MRNFDGIRRLIFPVAILLLSLVAVQGVFAAPASQFAECGPGSACFDPVSPEPDEYYAITCTNNAIWVWVPLPAGTFVAFIPVVQVLALADGAELPVPIELTLTRSGDTLTLSGSSGRAAPEASSKSFSLNECITRLGGVPEMIPTLPLPSDEADACRSLPTEAEVTECFAALSFTEQTCESIAYAIDHPEECFEDPCVTWEYRMLHEEECTLESSYEILFRFISYCFNPINPVLGVISLAAFSRRKRRQAR